MKAPSTFGLYNSLLTDISQRSRNTLQLPLADLESKHQPLGVASVQ
jgi:hypothetical protein